MTAMIGLYWWKSHAEKFPNWCCLYSLHLLLQTVFSVLANSFSSRQEAALEDYSQLSIMLQYNSEKFFFLRVFVRIVVVYQE